MDEVRLRIYGKNIAAMYSTGIFYALITNNKQQHNTKANRDTHIDFIKTFRLLNHSSGVLG